MDGGALNHALKRGGGNRLGAFDVGDQIAQLFVDEIDERAAQFFGVDATRLHHAGCVGFVDQRQQKMFQCCELMASRVGKGQRGMNCLLKCV